MGKRGKVTKITVPPTAEQFNAACEKLALSVASLTTADGDKPRLEEITRTNVTTS
jgi:hypothetical protein